MNTGNIILDGVLNIFFLCVIAGVGITLLFLLVRWILKVLMVLISFAALPFILLFTGLWFVVKIILWPLKRFFSFISKNRIKKEFKQRA